MRSLIRPAIMSMVVMTVLTGFLYPGVVTGIAVIVFPHQAHGSLIGPPDSARGSLLIGQSFSDPRHFWSRPSATSPVPYNSASSVGSNLGPSNPAQIKAVSDNAAALRAADSTNKNPIPVDLVTASGSGLDPDISPAAAEYQVPRVARATGLPEDQVRALVKRFTHGRQLGFLGEARVTVLPLNLALDSLRKAP